MYNGVRHSAICSPVLFCVPFDYLLIRQEAARAGCYTGNYYISALCYADDLTLLAPTAAAMRTLLTICVEYANEHAMTFKADKSECIVFKPRSVACHQERPTFSVAGKEIDYTSSWPHLGNIVSQN